MDTSQSQGEVSSQFYLTTLGQDVSNIKFGNTFTTDGLQHETFDYMLSNPPFGVEWKKVQTHVKTEYEKKGFDGRFGAGLPRISDGSFLFLQHMISKIKRDNGVSRIAIVFNGSPLFSGSAGSGESEIRKWIIENDLLEAIVALPDQLFDNKGIYTYIWIVTNNKAPARKGKIQLINGIHYYKKMSRSLGNKRNEIGDGENGKLDQIAEITSIYGEFQADATRRLEVDGKEKDIIVSKIFDNEDFGYWRITVERLPIFQFIQSSQPQAWQKLSDIHGLRVEPMFIQRLYKELEFRGMLDVLRYGITDYGVGFKLAFFKPASSLNPETLALYEQNILTVTRQVRYSTKHENSVDLVLSINGLPVATIELKNQFTGQDVENAKRQYEQDRDNLELLFQFKRRAMVHFAVDPDEAWMTTRIESENTRFLPFNKGYNKGAGNPPNPNGYKTAYLWEDIWTKDSWMEIVGHYLHLKQEQIKLDGRFVKKETFIFPRFHQLDVVRKLLIDAEAKGAGQNYLIQHSAGSGKSNSIAWLAYQLASLYNNQDKRVFDSVIVISDRRLLDQQLQDTIYQFEHKQGVVQKVDRNSSQLVDALTSGTNIIITTLQKFPFVLDKIGQLPQRNYALIVDEAHSSQGA